MTCAHLCRPPPLRWRATRSLPSTAPTARGGSTRAGRASRTSTGGTCSAAGRYLRGIGAWGTHHYTDEGWDEGWPKDCEHVRIHDRHRRHQGGLQGAVTSSTVRPMQPPTSPRAALTGISYPRHRVSTRSCTESGYVCTAVWVYMAQCLAHLFTQFQSSL